jgi:hypothetical protein
MEACGGSLWTNQANTQAHSHVPSPLPRGAVRSMASGCRTLHASYRFKDTGRAREWSSEQGQAGAVKAEAFTRRFTHTNDLRFPEPRNLNGTEPTHS